MSIDWKGWKIFFLAKIIEKVNTYHIEGVYIHQVRKTSNSTVRYQHTHQHIKLTYVDIAATNIQN